MRTHEYKIGKGYPAELKDTIVTWPLPTTIQEAISGGFFKDESVLLHRACANLNVDKGHAIQDYVLERVEKNEGLPTVAEMAKVAAETNADGEVRRRGTGGQKAKAQAFTNVTSKAAERWASASAEQRRFLVEIGMFNEDGTPVTPAAEAKQNGAKDEAKPTGSKGNKQKAAK